MLSGRRILVVDSEPDELVYVATVLEDNGATTVRARDGDEAVDLARRTKPDLITLEPSMQGESGVEVFESLRKDPALHQIPICIITNRPDLRRLLTDMPALVRPDGYVDKPIPVRALVLAIRKILEIRAAAMSFT